MNLKSYLLIILVFFLHASVLAQGTGDSLSVRLDTIEVTAARSALTVGEAPFALSVTSRNEDQLNASSSLSLKSISGELPGLLVSDRHNYALGERMTIRGLGWRAAFGVRGIQVVLDGIPLTIADGQSMTNIIDPAFVRRSELIRGPASTYWGNSAGGVLYLSTQPDLRQGTQVRLRSMGGSFGLGKGEAELSIAKSGYSLNAYSSYLSTDGFRDYSSARLWRSGVNGSVRLTSKSRLKYRAATFYMPKAQHPSSLTAQQASENPDMAVESFQKADAGKEITQTQAGLSYLLDTGEGTVTFTGYGIYRDLSNPLPFGIITVDRLAGGLRGTWEQTYSNLDLQAGAELKLQNDDRREFENAGSAQKGAVTVDQTEKVWNQALFANGTYHWENINISGGLRLDRLRFSTDAPSETRAGERSFHSVSPNLGISYHPASRPMTLFANVSTSFQAPTTTELVNRPGGGNGFNPEIKPERTLGLEMGIRKQSGQRLTYDLAVYRLKIYDLLFPYRLEADGPIYYRNQGETLHTGIEASGSYRLKETLRFSITADLLKATFREAQTLDSLSLKDKEIPGIPNFKLHSTLQWTPKNFFTSLSFEYADRYTVNNLNTAYNDAYGIFDFKLSYRYRFRQTSVVFRPFINVENIFDTRYNGSVAINNPGRRYYEPAPGRHWSAGLSLTF